MSEANELEQIRARHEADERADTWPAAKVIHADRATLLRLLDAARETQRDAILAWRKRGAELDAAREELASVKKAISIETKGSLAWWVDRAAQHAEDMEEDGFQIDRDHWERIVFAAQTQVARILAKETP